jgi:hypothetical protein
MQRATTSFFTVTYRTVESKPKNSALGKNRLRFEMAMSSFIVVGERGSSKVLDFLGRLMNPIAPLLQFIR